MINNLFSGTFRSSDPLGVLHLVMAVGGVLFSMDPEVFPFNPSNPCGQI